VLAAAILEAVEAVLTFAFARICGGIILSGPKACRGSTKDAKIFPAFLHSPALDQYSCTTLTALSDDLLLIEEGIGLLIPNGIWKVARAPLELLNS
jgi:hypothetical protein